MVIFKSLIRSSFDYIFIPLLTDTQLIKDDIQKLQNRVLRNIHFFPIKTKITTIHNVLKVDLLNSRLTKLFSRFVQAKSHHKLINQELSNYVKNANQRFFTLFDIYLET